MAAQRSSLRRGVAGNHHHWRSSKVKKISFNSLPFSRPLWKKPRLEARLPHDWVPLEGGDYSRLRDPSQRRHSTAAIPGLSK